MWKIIRQIKEHEDAFGFHRDEKIRRCTSCINMATTPQFQPDWTLVKLEGDRKDQVFKRM